MRTHFLLFSVFVASLYVPGIAGVGDDVAQLEALLNSGRAAEAAQLLSRYNAPPDLNAASEDELRIELARARLLALTNQTARAIELRRALDPALSSRFGGAHPSALDNRRALAIRLSYAGETENALELLRRVVADARVRLGENDPFTIRAEITLGQVLDQARQPASELLSGVVRRAETIDDPETLDQARFALLQMLRQERRLDEALVQAQQIHGYRRQRYGEADARTMRAEIEYSVLVSGSGRADDALETLKSVAARAELRLDVDSAPALEAQAARAFILFNEGRFADAADAYERLIPRLQKLWGESNPFFVDHLNRYVNASVQSGRPKACALVQDPMTRNVLHAPENRIERLAILSQCNRLAGRTDEAIVHMSELMKTEAGEASSLAALDWTAMYGELLLQANRPKEALPVLRDFVERAERLRRESVFAAPAAFGTWVESKRFPAGYKALVLLEAQSGNGEAAWNTAELSKGRQLVDSEFAAATQRNAPAEVQQRIQQATAEARAAEIELALSSDRSIRLAAGVKLDTARRVVRELGVKATEPPAVIATTVIAANELFVHAVAYDDQYVAVLRGHRGPPKVVVVPMRGLPALISSANRALAESNTGSVLWRLSDGSFVDSFARPASDAARLPDADALPMLAQVMIASIEPHLRGIDRLVIAPDGALALLPFDALPVRGRPLGESVVVSYAHSFAVLAQSRQRLRSYTTTKRRELLAIGVAQPQLPAGLDSRLAKLDWPLLPGVRAEIDGIATQYRGKQAEVLLDQAASEPSIRALATGKDRFRLIHFAAHAWFSDSSPDLSAIVLGDAKGGDRTAGYLTAAEIRGLQLTSDLVVLSACSSTGAAAEAGEGLTGLVHALFIAGSAGAVVSLWPVADEPTAELMVDFHRRLRAGAPPSDALANAKRALMRRGAPARDWAAFVLYGAR